jgi:hypothetical protein
MKLSGELIPFRLDVATDKKYIRSADHCVCQATFQITLTQLAGSATRRNHQSQSLVVAVLSTGHGTYGQGAAYRAADSTEFAYLGLMDQQVAYNVGI